MFYESGDMEEINVASKIAANKETRVIKLKHPDRDIRKVTFSYKTERNAAGEKADVELYGLKTNQPAGVRLPIGMKEKTWERCRRNP